MFGIDQLLASQILRQIKPTFLFDVIPSASMLFGGKTNIFVHKLAILFGYCTHFYLETGFSLLIPLAEASCFRIATLSTDAVS